MERVFDKLQRIRELWKEIERAKPNTFEYEAIVEKIRVLSAEYMALIDVPKKPYKSK